MIGIGLSFIFLLDGCVEYRESEECKKITYMTFEEFRLQELEVLPAREIQKAKKIYIYNNLLFISEEEGGIHIIDNHDKKNPINKSFLNIGGNIDMAVKDGYLYVDSYMDLLVWDIRDIEHIQLVTRKNDTFTYDSQNYYFGYHNCGFDLSKGIMVKEEDK